MASPGEAGSPAFQLGTRRTDDLAAPLEIVRTVSPPKKRALELDCTHDARSVHRMLCRGLMRLCSSIMDGRRRDRSCAMCSAEVWSARGKAGVQERISESWQGEQSKVEPRERPGRLRGQDPQTDCGVWGLGFSLSTHCFHQQPEEMKSQKLIDT